MSFGEGASFLCERPYALYALLPVIPAFAWAIRRYQKRLETLALTALTAYPASVRRIALRMLLTAAAWSCLVAAYAGISWGTALERVARHGSEIAFVFDISYSMTAEDGSAGLTRLESAAKYASMLLPHVNGCFVSATLAKGNGVTVIPMTEDKAALEALLPSLSPQLVASAGSSLGKGVTAALDSFLPHSAASKTLWIFTDGDETDGQLEASLDVCMKSGVSAGIIGFGTEKGAEVRAGGSGKLVMSALKSRNMQEIAARLMKKNTAFAAAGVRVAYVDAAERGSAVQLLDMLGGRGENGSLKQDADAGFAYEVRPIKRHRLFLAFALLFYAARFAVSEWNARRFMRLFKKNAAGVTFLSVFMFTSCTSGRIDGARTVLAGTWAWYRKDYNAAVADFLSALTTAKASGDDTLEQYALYGLALTYMSQNQFPAALERFAMISDSAPPSLRFAAAYHAGLIAHKKGDYEEAVRRFRQALQADGSKIDAKINLEISQNDALARRRMKNSGITGVSEEKNTDAAEETIFKRIQEMDRKQWKNSETEESSGSSLDY